MKVFVWERIKRASSNYHSEGGVVVFAETEERARELANESGWECTIAADELPDEVREVVGGEEKMFIMIDAGCC